MLDTVCTHFDVNYLPTGLSLYRSLKTVTDDFDFWILALDDHTERILDRLGLENVTVVSLDTLEESNPDLRAAKADRTTVEYYFTCTPAFSKYVLERGGDIDRVTYTDADLFFFDDFSAVDETRTDRSVILHPHRFPPEDRDLAATYGTYNAGFASFKNDETGRSCVNRWCEKCIDWCYERTEDGKYASQKYLESWPEIYENTAVLDHPGVGLAPWNVGNHDVIATADGVRVDGQSLVFYHFHDLERVNRLVWRTFTPLSDQVKKHVYRPYLDRRERELARIRRQDAKLGKDSSVRHGDSGLKPLVYRYGRAALALRRGEVLFRLPTGRADSLSP